MTKRLYISDLDGTLLDESAQLSARSRRGLQHLLDAGIAFSVASARSYFSIRSIFGDLPITLPIIEFNGAYLTDYVTGRHIEINALESDLAREIYDLLLERRHRPFVSTFDGQRDRLFYDRIVNSSMQWYVDHREAMGDPRLELAPKLRETLDQAVVSLTVMAESREEIVALDAELSSIYGSRLRTYYYENAYSRGSWWLTVHHARASKHIAMARLRELVAPGADLVTFGDNLNDMDMMQHADHAVAVDNAVPDVKSLAHRIIGHHRDHSVVAFLEQDFLGEAPLVPIPT